MVTDKSTTDLDIVDPAQWGPKMLALPNDKWRNFVIALFDDESPPKGEGLILYAARKAGMGTPTSSNKSIGVIGGRVCHDQRTQEAIAEYSIGAVRGGLAPDVVRAIKSVVQDPKHRDHARILSLVYERLDPAQTLHTVRVHDERPGELMMATEKALARIEEIARRYNLSAPPATIIDGDCRDITPRVPA